MRAGIKVFKERRNQFRTIKQIEFGSFFDQFGDLRHVHDVAEIRKLASADSQAMADFCTGRSSWTACSLLPPSPGQPAAGLESQ
jgi:hypothetical protein